MVLWLGLSFFAVILVIVFSLQRNCNKNSKNLKKKKDEDSRDYGMTEFDTMGSSTTDSRKKN
jgi:hypothetical protein